jgi:N-acetylglucosaminyl-diphospho-decaprenol L-rhamnosyltransferase
VTDVSVIIIGHNVADEVLRAFTAVDAHAGDVDVQRMYVDNGSTDGTVAALRERFPSVEIVELPRNIGNPARNRALPLSRGRYVLFLDSDAELLPGALERLVGVLDDDPSAGLVGPALLNPDGTRQLNARRFPPLLLPIMRRGPLARHAERRAAVRRHLMANDPHDRRRRVEYLISACVLFRRELGIAVGGMDERMPIGHADADFCLKIRRAGADVVYAPDAEVVHDYRRSTAAKPWSRKSIQFVWAFLLFQAKWWTERRALVAEGRAMDDQAARSAA